MGPTIVEWVFFIIVGMFVVGIFVGIPLRIIAWAVSTGNRRNRCEGCGKRLAPVPGRWGNYHPLCGNCGRVQSRAHVRTQACANERHERCPGVAKFSDGTSRPCRCGCHGHLA